jgi:hypothetical protein
MPAASSSSSVAADDASAIRALLDQRRDAWNRHDMDAFVADLVPDIEWINVLACIGRDVTPCAGRMRHCTRA